MPEVYAIPIPPAHPSKNDKPKCINKQHPLHTCIIQQYSVLKLLPVDVSIPPSPSIDPLLTLPLVSPSRWRFQVLAGGEKAVVQFIPRIDLVALSADPETAAARKAIRPPQRFFNPEEASFFFLSLIFFFFTLMMVYDM